MIRTLILLSLIWLPVAAGAGPVSSIPAASALCRAAILQAEHAGHVPERLLDAIAVVESGRRDPVSGAVYPWPWTINAEGVGHFYASKAEAIAAVLDFQAHGVRSMDVGCMQVNLMYHPEAFASLDQAFDPVSNARYAAQFLQQLYTQTNAWPLAAAAYHSWTPDRGAEYARRVLAAWSVPEPPVANQLVTGLASAMGAPAMPGAAGLPAPGGRVAVMLPAGNEAIRVLAMPGAPAQAVVPPASPGGSMVRGLDFYRANPVTNSNSSIRRF